MLLAITEVAGIVSEAINDVALGRSKSIDEYCYSTKAYEATINTAEQLTDKGLDDINRELFKETEDVNLDTLSDKVKDLCVMYSESSTVGMLRLMKAMLFKGLYVLLAPIRYMIYLYLYGKCVLTDRIAQMKKTIEIYDSKNSVTEREVQMESLSKTANNNKVDRIQTLAKVDTEISKDKKENTTEVNSLIDV